MDVDGVQIMIIESDVYIFLFDEVCCIVWEEVLYDNLKNKIIVYDGEGFINIIILGYGFGIGIIGDEWAINNDEDYFLIYIVNGYYIN